MTGYDAHVNVVDTTVRAASSAGGQVLRAATGLVSHRPAAKPLHPRGAVLRGTLHRHGSRSPSGVPWIDRAGEDRVVVRESRAVGAPSPTPDIFGLALRVPVEGSHADLLFASTGLGRLSRFTLTFGRAPYSRPLTTLLPYRAPAGPLVLSAVYVDRRRVSLAWAAKWGRWHRFAELVMDEEPSEADDQPVSFDPVRHQLPGLRTYSWVRRLREPSYARARRSRGD